MRRSGMNTGCVSGWGTGKGDAKCLWVQPSAAAYLGSYRQGSHIGHHLLRLTLDDVCDLRLHLLQLASQQLMETRSRGQVIISYITRVW